MILFTASDVIFAVYLVLSVLVAVGMFVMLLFSIEDSVDYSPNHLYDKD